MAGILMLDEATSHLDTESERLIQQATDTLIKDRTSFITAYHLSIVLHAHEEFLERSQTYKRLHALQFNEPN